MSFTLLIQIELSTITGPRKRFPVLPGSRSCRRSTHGVGLGGGLASVRSLGAVSQPPNLGDVFLASWEGSLQLGLDPGALRRPRKSRVDRIGR